MSSRWQGELVRHPASPAGPIERITVTIARAATDVTITYDLAGDLAQVILPERGPAERRDGLWTATCFELFARATGDDAYLELNFAPDTAWAAFAFDAYRTTMRKADVKTPAIEMPGPRMEVTADLSLLPTDALWRVGLSAVIKHADGHTSYWALAHPPGKPDFHHDDCFTIELAPSRNS